MKTQVFICVSRKANSTRCGPPQTHIYQFILTAKLHFTKIYSSTLLQTCIQFLCLFATMNSPTKTSSEHVSWYINVIISLRQILRNGIAGSAYMKIYFQAHKITTTFFFKNSCSRLYSHQQYRRSYATPAIVTFKFLPINK